MHRRLAACGLMLWLVCPAVAGCGGPPLPTVQVAPSGCGSDPGPGAQGAVGASSGSAPPAGGLVVAAGSPVQAHVGRSSFGLNVAAWDGAAADPSTAGVVRRLGVGVLQFPDAGNEYSWQLNRDRNPLGGYGSWEKKPLPFSLAAWSRLLQATRTQGLFIVNYGANASWTGGGTAADALAITRYVLAHHIPVSAMVIGSEEYGNWQVNLHRRKTPQRYAAVAKSMIDAIHSLAPHMPVGVDLIAPIPGSQRSADGWNPVVLRADAPAIDFVSVHLYPLSHIETGPAMMQALAADLPAAVRKVRDELTRYAGPYASHIGIWFTEYGPYGVTPPPQSVQPTYGGVLLQSLVLLATSGARQVDWWNLHNGAFAAESAGQTVGVDDHTPGTAYGTFGIAADGQPPEPSVNTLYPSGLAYAALMQAVGTGAQVCAWPDLIARSSLFLAEVRRPGRVSWIVVNGMNQARDFRLGAHLSVPVPADGWKVVTQPGS